MSPAAKKNLEAAAYLKRRATYQRRRGYHASAAFLERRAEGHRKLAEGEGE